MGDLLKLEQAVGRYRRKLDKLRSEFEELKRYDALDSEVKAKTEELFVWLEEQADELSRRWSR